MAMVSRRRGVLTAAAGSLVHSSWIAMQSCGEADPDVCQFDDFAPVELAAAVVVDVNPSVPFFGGPIGLDVDAGGEAAGLLSTFDLAPLPVSNGVSDLALSLAYAGEFGGLRAELVSGTEPSTPLPAGIPLTDVAPPAGPPIGGRPRSGRGRRGQA